MLTPLYIIPHIPKTGGYALKINLSRVLLPYVEVHIPNGEEEFNKIPLSEMSQDQLNRIRVIIGHNINTETSQFFNNREVRYITFLRDPISRMISHYNFDMSHYYKEDIPIDTWFNETEHANYMVKWLSTNFLKQNFVDLEEIYSSVNSSLKKFHIVGLTEEMDLFCDIFFKELGVEYSYIHTHVSGKDYRKVIDISQIDSAKYEMHHLIDYKLYNFYKNKV